MNWVIGAQQTWARDVPAQRALSGAWTRLRAEGLVSWDPAQSSEDSVFVTRSGEAVLEQGLGYLRATERLDIDPHHLLEVKARPHILRGDSGTAIFVAMKEVEVRVRELA